MRTNTSCNKALRFYLCHYRVAACLCLCSGGSRAVSMGSMEPLFWRAAFENIMRKRTHTGATHFSFKVAIMHNLNSIISCIDARMTYVHVYTNRSIETMSELKQRFFCYAMHPLQLGMSICYQYESAYFPAPCADNQLLCTLCDPKRSHTSDSVGESKRNN